MYLTHHPIHLTPQCSQHPCSSMFWRARENPGPARTPPCGDAAARPSATTGRSRGSRVPPDVLAEVRHIQHVVGPLDHGLDRLLPRPALVPPVVFDKSVWVVRAGGSWSGTPHHHAVRFPERGRAAPSTPSWNELAGDRRRGPGCGRAARRSWSGALRISVRGLLTAGP